jgi:hypothetical protein
MRRLDLAVLVSGALLLMGAAGPAGADDAVKKEIPVNDSTFRCVSEMTKVRHFFVDNLLGDLKGTVAVASSTTGGAYPPGSVLQLVPTEVMIKQQPGYNPATKDWEFFELNISPEGSKIRTHGFMDVVNRFGGNCFACHVKAKPEFDFVCELDHGCDPIPVTRPMIAALQHSDPRCKNAAPLSAEDTEALKQLQALSAPPANPGIKK